MSYIGGMQGTDSVKNFREKMCNKEFVEKVCKNRNGKGVGVFDAAIGILLGGPGVAEEYQKNFILSVYPTKKDASTWEQNFFKNIAGGRETSPDDKNTIREFVRNKIKPDDTFESVVNKLYSSDIFTDNVGLKKNVIAAKEQRKEDLIKIINNEFNFKTYISKDLPIFQLEEIYKYIHNNKVKQFILSGPPGTGKTRYASIIAAKLVMENNIAGNKNTTEKDWLDEYDRIVNNKNSNIKLVQFHPNYSYEDFVYGIGINSTDTGKVIYKEQNKSLLEFVEEKMKDSKENNNENNNNNKENYVLIIDEINRAQVSSVLGELLYALEYRGKSMSIGNSGAKLTLPENLSIIGTMNTADCSITDLDYAVRRRFSFFHIPPNFQPEKNEDVEFAKGLCELIYKIFNNSTFLSNGVNASDIQIGTSYFLYKKNDKEHLRYKIEYEIMPLLKEYIKDGLLRKKVIITLPAASNSEYCLQHQFLKLSLDGTQEQKQDFIKELIKKFA